MMTGCNEARGAGASTQYYRTGGPRRGADLRYNRRMADQDRPLGPEPQFQAALKPRSICRRRPWSRWSRSARNAPSAQKGRLVYRRPAICTPVQGMWTVALLLVIYTVAG